MYDMGSYIVETKKQSLVTKYNENTLIENGDELTMYGYNDLEYRAIITRNGIHKAQISISKKLIDEIFTLTPIVVSFKPKSQAGQYWENRWWK